MSDSAPRYPPQVKYIVASEACERFSFYGMSTILVPYMERALGWSETHSLSTYHYFVSAAFFMEILDGQIISPAIPQMAQSFGSAPVESLT